MTTITIERRVKKTMEVPEYFKEAGGYRYCRLLSQQRYISVGKGVIVELPVSCLGAEIETCSQEEFERAFNESLNELAQYATSKNS